MVGQRHQPFAHPSLSMQIPSNEVRKTGEEDSSNDSPFDGVGRLQTAKHSQLSVHDQVESEHTGLYHQ